MNNFLTKITVATLSFAAVALVSAQRADAKSKSLLEAVSANYKSNKNTYFKFIYGSGNGQVSKTQTGIFYTTPSQYRLKIMGTEQIFDGNKVYSISAEDQEVTIAKATGAEMMLSPTNYLSTYKKDFNTSYVGKKSVAGVSTDLVRLTPVKNNGIKYVNIYLNPANRQIVKIEQFGTNNDVATILVKDYRTNQKLSPDMFTFNKNNYKNYIITDL